jgi:HD-GYP domain-containing protein (c-di-GMP phosphodiesterase class II)
MLAALSHAIEERDPYTRGHSARVTALAERVAVRLRWDEPLLGTLRIGAQLHDIGKLAVPDRILRKPGPLDDDELAQIRTHPTVGAKLIGPVGPARVAIPSVLYHHERWDGGGYPTGRAGTTIPVEARLLAIADAFDAMTSDRSYRRALAADRALAELDRCAGGQFDPDLTRAFLDAWEAEAAPAERASPAAARR